MAAPDREALRNELIEWMGRPGAGADPGPDADFDAVARRVFARSFHAVPVYAAYCRARGRTPEAISHWTAIPAVPTAAFREVPLAAADRPAERVFRTSGTTRGPERRGAHHVLDLDVYRASLRATFRAFVLPDDARLPMLSLMPPASALPDSSLAFMISDVLATYGAEGSDVFASAAEREAAIDLDRLESTLDALLDRDQPVLLLGTSAAFIRWMDRLEAGDRRIDLPPGSRLMDTGGFKGAGRQVEPEALRALYRTRLGLPANHCVNEYGMTELLSQRYDDGLLRHHHGEAPTGRKRGPGWLRTVAVDPETLEPVPEGEPGILRHVDLANLDSVPAVQTEDVGRVVDGAVVLEGRASGAPPRGCSIAMDLLLDGTS